MGGIWHQAGCCCWSCPTTTEVQPSATVELLVENCEAWVEATVAGEYTYSGMDVMGDMCNYSWYALREWDDVEFYWWLFLGEETLGGVGGVCRCMAMGADSDAPNAGYFESGDCPCPMGGTDVTALIELDGAELWTGTADLPGWVTHDSEGCTVRTTLNP